MTNVLEEILKDNQSWRINENPMLNKATEAYKQFNAAFDNFYGALLDLYPDKEQDAQGGKIFDKWESLDEVVEKMLVFHIAKQAGQK